MTPIEIRIELLKVGLTQSDIARRLGCSVSLVNMVIHQRAVSRRVMQAVARALMRDVQMVFPDYYFQTSNRA